MAPSDSKLRQLAAELDDADDEITAEHYINVEPGGTVIVDQTGKHKALELDETTPTDPPRKVESDAPPPSKVSPLTIAWLLARKFPPWGAVIVALAGIAAYVLLRR